MQGKLRAARCVIQVTGTVILLSLAACHSSSSDIVSAKCASASQALATNSGKDPGAAQFMGSMIAEICKQAVQQCNEDPDGADCQKARAVLEAAP